MIKLAQILFFGMLLFGVHSSKAQNIDSSFTGTYAVVLNYLEYDTVGHIILTNKTYTYIHKASEKFEYNRTFMIDSLGEYAIRKYENTYENDSLNHFIIDFDPKNTNRNWSQLLHSTLGLYGGNGNWYLKDQTSRSFPQYIFYKIE